MNKTTLLEIATGVLGTEIIDIKTDSETANILFYFADTSKHSGRAMNKHKFAFEAGQWLLKQVTNRNTKPEITSICDDFNDIS